MLVPMMMVLIWRGGLTSCWQWDRVRVYGGCILAAHQGRDRCQDEQDGGQHVDEWMKCCNGKKAEY